MPSNEQYINRRKRRFQEINRKIATKVVVTVNPEKDSYTFLGAEGKSREEIPIHQPYLTADSWIRACPPRGSGVRVFQKLEENDVVQSFDMPKRDVLIEKYRQGKGIYRPIYPGEFEISSSGIAQTYWSNKGRWEARGGSISVYLDNQKLEAGFHAPLHRRMAHAHVSNEIKDEERFGVVTRPINAIETKYIKNNDDEFSKEYLRVINRNAFKLVDRREGDVIDDEGDTIESEITGKALRSRTFYYTKNGQEVIIEFDEEGNANLILPSDATEGGYVEIPSGALKMIIKNELDVEAYGNTFKMENGKITLKVKNGPELVMDRTKGVTVNGHNLLYHELGDFIQKTWLVSTNLGYAGWPTAHNPGVISGYGIQYAIPGNFKSNSGIA